MRRRAMAGSKRRRAARWVFLVLSGFAAAVVGLALVRHPIVGWPYGDAHKSDAPPALGVGLLVWPAVLVGVGIRRLCGGVSLAVEARRLRRGRRARR
jgi:hypothetical protein